MFGYLVNASFLKILSFLCILFGRRQILIVSPYTNSSDSLLFFILNGNGFIIYLASLLTSVLNRSCVSSYI